ncbi:UPF0132-containing protein [Glarea lozoyensis ATCC 20868]|uniref:UPF0132-containing protein n=1 Tax=Glarea lozoyensis (strain ATCC 20868 / MF5171) TaxID=1116229 RepID=S3DE27_GLAL2|nr:UPF0132-containing protein [Glarea lozoyensis ATCC 20868]EPE36677.1 UPF0132-containing protein [Glarea lozoyensis ATCC 20868]
MDFAPYQDQSPETTRALSPPPQARRSISPGRRSFSPALQSPTKASPTNNPWAPSPSAAVFSNDGIADVESGRTGRLNEFETSLPIRLDYEACLAYLLLPPAGGVLLLVAERKSDYVRFHAWQSSLLFSAIFVLHLIFSWWSFISWVLFAGDIALIGYLTFRAYRDADTLDRCEVPFFGRLASSILDDE